MLSPDSKDTGLLEMMQLMSDNPVDTLDMCMWIDLLCTLTAAGLQADLQTQVVHRAHHPQVAGGSDVELQPAFVSCPQQA